MSSISKLPRVGSHTSVASSGSSVDVSSHNHVLNSIRPASSLRTWLQESMVDDHRHERIATGIMSAGIAAMTREVVGMHIEQPPDIRHILDNLPTARAEDLWIRRRLRSWSIPKPEEVTRKLGTWPLTKNEALLAKQYPVSTAMRLASLPLPNGR